MGRNTLFLHQAHNSVTYPPTSTSQILGQADGTRKKKIIPSEATQSQERQVDISCTVKDNHATIHKPRKAK